MVTTSKSPIFITGCNGLVGSYITRLIVRSGYPVIGLVVPGSGLELLGDAAGSIEVVEGTLEDWEVLRDGMERARVVIHAAGSVTMDPSRNMLLQRVNQEGTRRMVDIALDTDIDHFIQISSITAIGISTDPQEINEDTPWQESPLNLLYARSKFAAEREVWRAAEEGLPMSIINPGLVIGAGRWSETSSKLILDAYKGNPYLPKGSNAFVDVRDVAAVVLRAIELGPSNDRVIAAPINATWAEYMSKMAVALGKKPPTQTTPQWFEPVASLLEKLQALVQRRERAFGMQTLRMVRGNFHYHSARPDRLAGIRFHSLDESIRDNARAFLDSYPKGKGYAILPID